MASIKPYQSKGVTKYRVQVYAGTDELTGKKRYRSRQGIKTEHEARVVAAKLEYAIAKGDDVEKPKMMTFAQASDIYWQSYVLTVRQTTSATVQKLLNDYILPDIGDYRMAAINPAVLQKTVNWWAKKIPSAVGRCLNYVQSVFRLAEREDIISKDPSSLVTKPKIAKQRENDQLLYWNREQVAKFFSCLDPDKDLEKIVAFKLLFYGGLRRGELLALTWSDLQIVGKDQVQVSVNKTLVAHKQINPPKTRASYRTVPIIDTELVELLAEWKQRQKTLLHEFGERVKPDSRQFLFTTRKNTSVPLVLPGKWLAAIIQENDLKPRINLHKTRHSYISNLLMSGVTVPVVMKMVGHTKPDVTLMIYSHVNQQSKIDAAQTLSAYLKTSTKDSGKDSGNHTE